LKGKVTLVELDCSSSALNGRRKPVLSWFCDLILRISIQIAGTLKSVAVREEKGGFVWDCVSVLVARMTRNRVARCVCDVSVDLLMWV